MRTMITSHSLIAASLLLAACVRVPVQPPPPPPAAPPPAASAQPIWGETHYKVGARLYPRCMELTATGSRINKTTYCLTDDEIARLEDGTQSMRVDMQQRSAIDLGKGGN